MTLPKRLMKLRKTAGLSQEEVADKLEVTRQTVSKWETGQSSPDLDKVLPLCELYNIAPDDLFYGDDSFKTSDTPKTPEMPNKTQPTTDLEDQIIAKRRLIGILGGVNVYFVAIAFMMVAVPVFMLNPITAAAIFLLLIDVATILIICSAIINKRKKKVRTRVTVGKAQKHITRIIKLIILAIYLVSSFATRAWGVTWIIWLLYPIAKEIIALIMDLNRESTKGKV